MEFCCLIEVFLYVNSIFLNSVFIDVFVEINAYCVIKCGRKIVRTPISNKTTSPEWNTTALFYRRHPSKTPICVEVSRFSSKVSLFFGIIPLYQTATVLLCMLRRNFSHYDTISKE